MTHKTITAEMVIGLKSYPDQFVKVFHRYYGWSREGVPVKRIGLGVLGSYQPHDIGKRVDSTGRVESNEDVLKRTGLTFEQHYNAGVKAINFTRKKYNGEKNILGRTINPLEIPKRELMLEVA